ncbi:MAG: M48 family metallopeptidase, partial [Peptococcaceae bacterium]
LSLPQPEFTVRKMRASWGLCYSQSHKIVLNLWLAMAPPDCIQQVLIHEYLHFCQSNHGPQFYALMEQFEPQYRQLKQKLSVMVDLRELAE